MEFRIQKHTKTGMYRLQYRTFLIWHHARGYGCEEMGGFDQYKTKEEAQLAAIKFERRHKAQKSKWEYDDMLIVNDGVIYTNWC